MHENSIWNIGYIIVLYSKNFLSGQNIILTCNIECEDHISVDSCRNSRNISFTKSYKQSIDIFTDCFEKYWAIQNEHYSKYIWFCGKSCFKQTLWRPLFNTCSEKIKINYISYFIAQNLNYFWTYLLFQARQVLKHFNKKKSSVLMPGITHVYLYMCNVM